MHNHSHNVVHFMVMQIKNSIFSERELTDLDLSSLTFVCPTQPFEIFGNISTPFGTLAIC